MTLPTWRKIAEPHEDIRMECFDPAVFAADLGMVLRGEGPLNYVDPVTFFKKTYLTRGLAQLLRDALQRLSGAQQGEAVVQIQTAFGGGKTHVLIALYHLLAHGAQVAHLPMVQDLLVEAGLDAIPACRVAVLVGTALSAEHGRVTEEGLRLRTLWGEMAYQLGGADLYQQLGGEGRAAPGTDALLDLLDGLGPVVVLVDEALEYATKAGAVAARDGSTMLGQMLAFLQELSTVAANRPQTLLVGAIPLSYLERFDASAQRAFQQLNKIFGRLEQVRTPVEGAEIYEILRRRLFENVGTEAERRRVVEAVWDFYQAHAEDLPRKVREVGYRERMVRAYPFHPELVDILYERWGSLPNFQRTRGVLRLLALVVVDLYKRNVGGVLIQPAHVNLDVPHIRQEFVKLVDSAYETVIGSDIAGHGAKAPQIDRELGGDYAREQIAARLATAIFLYSHTGGTDRGAVLPQLRLALLHPEIALALVADALDRLAKRLWYLYDDPKWYFDKVPNLNRIQAEREDAVTGEAIEDRIRAVLGDVVGHGTHPEQRQRTFRHTYLWPYESRDIADDRRLGLVVLDLAHAAAEGETTAFIEGVLKKRGETFRMFRNALVFLLPDGFHAGRAQEKARTLLALEGIAADYGGSDRLTARQEETLTDNLHAARTALPQMVYQTYRHVAIPAGEGAEGTLERFDMGMQLYKRGASLSQLVWEHLKQRDKLLARLDPHLIRADLWTLWPDTDAPLRVSQLRDYFARYTQMPLLAREDVLVEAIARGVELGLFGYGQRASEEDDFTPLYFKQTLPSAQVKVTETAWLVPPDMAQQLTLHALAGRVEDAQGAPLAEVTVQVSPGGDNVVTGTNGAFAFEALPSGRYTLTPLRAGYVFSPAQRTVTLGDSVGDLRRTQKGEGSASVEDLRRTKMRFVGEEVVGPPQTYTLAGVVRTEDGLPLRGGRVVIAPEGSAPVITDTHGRYAFTDLLQGSYTLRPEKGGYTFTPTERAVALTGDTAGQDFIAASEAVAGEDVHSVAIRTQVPWERWYEFYNDVLDPLMSVGAEITVHVRMTAKAERALDQGLLERLRDGVQQYDEDGEVKVTG